MNIQNLNKIFHPKSIAVTGSKISLENLGYILLTNLLSGGYAGNIYPVYSDYKEILGLPVYSCLSNIEVPPELVITTCPINLIPDIIKQCSKLNIDSMMIASKGRRDFRQEQDVQNYVKNLAQTSGIRIIGTDSTGFISVQSNLNASFINKMPLSGKTAFISQSGSVFASALDISIQKKMGFSYFISLGSMIDVSFGEVIDYLGGDSQVDSILIYLENLSKFRNFMSAVRSVSRVKPVVVMKAARTPAGALAVPSHSGSMIGEDSVYEAAFKRSGIVRVKTFEDLFDCAEILTKNPHPLGPGLAIVSNAGGPGIVAIDALWDYGIEPAVFTSETGKKLEKILPFYRKAANPVILSSDASPQNYKDAVEICLNAKEVNGLLIILSPCGFNNPADIAKTLVHTLKGKKIPIFASWMGGPNTKAGFEIFYDYEIPVFKTPERAISAFMNLYQHSENIKLLQEIPSALSKKLNFDKNIAEKIIKTGLARENPLLTEIESKSLLAAYGIPVNPTELVTTGEEAWKKANKMGFPVVLKVYSPDILHKTDVYGVYLDLQTEFEVYKAFNEIMEKADKHYPDADIKGVTLQPMLIKMDYELYLGAKKDKNFGPVIIFGMGGVMTEIINDRNIALPPLNKLLAHQLIKETRIYKLLRGFRSYPSIDLNYLEEILIRLSQLVIDFPEIEALDINPLMAAKNLLCAVDARVILKPCKVKSPLHLVISPYPNQHEDRIKTKYGHKLFIRPIRPEDAVLLQNMFSKLSPRSVYFRFFSPLKTLNHNMLARFTQIDYDREIGLVAIKEIESDQKELKEEMLGIGRITMERNGENGEFSILVSDEWQGRGIGAELLGRCIKIAKNQGLKKIWGIVLPENKNMLALGEKLGFNISCDKESGDFILKLKF